MRRLRTLEPLTLTAVKLTPALRQAVERMAAERGVTMSTVLRDIIAEATKVPA